MTFKKNHPAYQSYEMKNLHVNDLPEDFFSKLEGYIVRYCPENNQLISVINNIASRIPCKLTQNWGRNFLMNDLSRYLRDFKKSEFHKQMDFLSDFYEKSQESIDIDEFNEFLDDLKIGYLLNYDSIQELSWELREDVECRVENIIEGESDIKDICTQTLDHLIQAKEHLLHTKNNRDRKDAIRDCMSAMEAMLKTITNEKDIKAATAAIRTTGGWGPDIIIKDGLSLWNNLHNIYPDVRHGNPLESDLTDEETLYWVDRIICFIKYIAKTYRIKQA